MYEMQFERLNAGFVQDSLNFFKNGFALEYLSANTPQMRTIPMDQAIESTTRIATYDELASIIQNADHIVVAECVCKRSQDLLDKPCERTTRREVCMYFRDFANAFTKGGWGREVSKEEAIEIARQNEEDGLILQASGAQDVEFICSCCSCCCGVLRTLSVFPKLTQLVASNYFAQVTPSDCKGCGSCVRRCNMNAIDLEDRLAKVNLDRCIGCGLCVPSCPKHAMHLVNKSKETIPPQTMDEMLDRIMAKKKGTLGKFKMVLKQNPLKVLQNIKNATKSIDAFNELTGQSQ
jgi:Fe-S-cluster-containing hydrogenase component 2